MIPTMQKNTLTHNTIQNTSRTYRMDHSTGRVLGIIDGLAAMEQAIYKILRTERFVHLIYSWNYGMEWRRGLGKSRRVAESELRRAIGEALCQDRRVTAVSQVSFFDVGRNALGVAVTTETIFGTVQAETEVSM